MKNVLKSLVVAGALFGVALSANAASAHDAGALFERMQQSGAETTYTQGINALSGGAYGYGGGRGYGGRGYGRGYYGGRSYGRGYGYGHRRFGGRGYYGGRGYGRGYGLGYRF